MIDALGRLTLGFAMLTIGVLTLVIIRGLSLGPRFYNDIENANAIRLLRRTQVIAYAAQIIGGLLMLSALISAIIHGALVNAS